MTVNGEMFFLHRSASVLGVTVNGGCCLILALGDYLSSTLHSLVERADDV